jgi:hypothetical protein
MKILEPELEIPVVMACRVIRPPEHDVLLVHRCPYCGGEHRHGASGKDSGSGDGPRVAHCGAGVYDVREVAA